MIEKTEADELEPLLWGIARPALTWALHFIFVYAALSATCSERAAVSYTAAAIGIGVATVVALVVAGWRLFRSNRTEFHIAARWTTVISLVAILFSASPVLLAPACG